MIKEYFKKNAKVVEKKLRLYLPKDSSIVSRAMRYSTLGGGKRFRAVLMMAVAEALGRPAQTVMPAACAVEMIHAFTLIHDDLPAMDDANYRRGKPTCHKVYGEDMAVLAGDALCILAYEVLAKKTDKKFLSDVLAELSVSLGVKGVVGGQELDLVSEGKKISLKKLQSIHAKKTGALILASVRMAGIICRASVARQKALCAYAHNMGMAFQIADDMLDVTSSTKKLGKPVGADAKNKKASYPAIVGIDRSIELAEKHVRLAHKALDIFGDRGRTLAKIASYSIKRRR